MATKEDIDNWFTNHAPTPERKLIYGNIREVGKAFAELVVSHVPQGNEQELALEKIREATMWANAGVACGGKREAGG